MKDTMITGTATSYDTAEDLGPASELLVLQSLLESSGTGAVSARCSADGDGTWTYVPAALRRPSDVTVYVTDEDGVAEAIGALRDEAAVAGDLEQVSSCDEALARRAGEAWKACLRALADAAARDEP